MSLLSVRGLSVTLATKDGPVAALSGVDLDLDRGEVLGLVGESGAGKSMLARTVAGMLPANARATGQVLVAGRDVLAMDDRGLADHRGASVAMCFQSARAALNPFRRVGHQVADRLRRHGHDGNPAEAAIRLLADVGLRDPARRARAYPHQLSGGMAQRVMIALALACQPALLLADEPTTGLDVTLTRAILRRFRQETERGRGVLLISHDLAAIAEVCDRILVLYAGTVAEEGPTGELLTRSAHPYTRALLDAVPDLAGTGVRPLEGVMPLLREPPAACPFAPRCPLAVDRCRVERPADEQIGNRRRAACYFGRDLAAQAVTA